jgi:hypothetical protein
MHRGGAAVVLDADYHVVDRAARFSGISKYHKGETSSFSVYSEGSVQIDLTNLDFANEGPGNYKEQVRLIDQIKVETQPCPAPFNLLKKTTTYYDFKPISVQRPITWKRDPAVPTRIVLYGVGAFQRHNANTDLISLIILQCGYIASVGRYAPEKVEIGCPRTPSPLLLPEHDHSGGPSVLSDPEQQIVPLQPAAQAYVVYSLRRAI